MNLGPGYKIVGRTRQAPGMPRGFTVIDPVAPVAQATTKPAVREQGPSARQVTAAALHEAGHAVIAHVLRVPVLRASISEGFDTVSGEVQTDHGTPALAARVSLAGAVTETVFRAQTNERIAACSGQDIEHAAAQLANAKWRSSVEDEFESTRQLVVMHRGAILQLAGELARRRSMTGDEVSDFLRGRIAHASSGPARTTTRGSRLSPALRAEVYGMSRGLRPGGRARAYETAVMPPSPMGAWGARPAAVDPLNERALLLAWATEQRGEVA